MHLYHNVYQLWRLLGRKDCDEGAEECIHWDILDSIKEHLWCKQPSAPPEVEQRWSPANAPRPDPQAELTARNCATYERFVTPK